MTALINPFWYAGSTTDPNFANVVLLAHFDGADQSTSFIDSSSKNHTLTGAGVGVKLVAANPKFGTASVAFPGGVNSGVRSADSADWDFGAGQFTVELFIRPTTAFTGTHRFIGQYQTPAVGNLAWALTFNDATGNFSFQYSTGGTTSLSVFAAYSPPLNAWTYIAVDRDAANVVRLYADGVVIASGAVAVTISNSTLPLAIGHDSANASSFVGQIDEVRITKGVARYGGAFAPPAAAFPDA